MGSNQHPTFFNNRRAMFKRPAMGVALFLALLLAAFASGTMSADVLLKDWRYSKSISLPSGLGTGKYAELALDRETSIAASKSLADLRIVSGDGAEVPYKLEVNGPQHQSDAVQALVKDRGYIVGQYVAFIADLGKEGLRHNQMKVNLSDTNFKRSAAVETSSNGDTWTQAGSQEIYRFTQRDRNFATGDTTINYADSTARYVKVKIFDGGEGPVDVTGASVSFIKDRAPREVSWPVANVSVGSDSQRKATLVVVDLGSEGIPSSHMTFKTADANFTKDVSVESSHDNVKWTPVSTATIFSYNTATFVGSQLDFTYFETTARYLRVVVQDQDSPAIKIGGVDVWGSQRTLIFQPDPSKSYKLYYGSSRARQPKYDAAAAFPSSQAVALPTAQLGQQTYNPMFAATGVALSGKYTWLIPVAASVVAFIAVLLMYVLFKRSRKATAQPT